MTKEDWETVEKDLMHPYGSAKLLCDGYELHLSMQFLKMRMIIFIYVNGWNRGVWSQADCEERRRFLRPVTTHIYRAKLRKDKKIRKLFKGNIDKTFTQWWPWWTSFKPLKAHLIKNNKSIEILDPSTSGRGAGGEGEKGGEANA